MDDNRIPSLHEALIETETEVPAELQTKPTPPVVPPPPPTDWVTNPITKAITVLVLIGIGVIGFIMTPKWSAYIEAHRFGSNLVGGAILMFVLIVIIAWWRARDIAAGAIYYTSYEEKRDREKVSRKP